MRFADQKMSDGFFKVETNVTLEFNSDKNRWSREIPLKNTSTDSSIAYALRTRSPDMFLFKGPHKGILQPGDCRSVLMFSNDEPVGKNAIQILYEIHSTEENIEFAQCYGF